MHRAKALPGRRVSVRDWLRRARMRWFPGRHVHAAPYLEFKFVERSVLGERHGELGVLAPGDSLEINDSRSTDEGAPTPLRMEYEINARGRPELTVFLWLEK
jgi:hypothetical protein